MTENFKLHFKYWVLSETRRLTSRHRDMIQVVVDELPEGDDHVGEPDVVVLVGGRADVRDDSGVGQRTTKARLGSRLAHT